MLTSDEDDVEAIVIRIVPTPNCYVLIVTKKMVANNKNKFPCQCLVYHSKCSGSESSVSD